MLKALVLALLLTAMTYSPTATGDLSEDEVANESMVAQESMERRESQELIDRREIPETHRRFQRTREEYFVVTAYTCGPESTGKYPGDRGYCVTASGHRLTNSDGWKRVAVDNSRIKFGTRMILHDTPLGDLYVIAVDTGGDIVNGRLDIFSGESNVSEALKWGRRTIRVTILD